MPATTELLREGRYRVDHSANPTGEEKVFEAYDTVRNTNVVVREIPVKLNPVATVSQRESLKLAFANQAKALTEIEHESLVHVHDYFSEIDRQYIVMEAAEGENLKDLLASRRKPFSLGEVMRWADELLDALSYLHGRKPPIIHRNIRPENVTLHPSGKIKLVGVGVGTETDPEFAVTSPDSDDLHYSPMEQIWPGLDAASQKAITNNYDDRSERILKQPLDERSDIYSLGATLYFLITGVEPVDPLERSIEILEGKLDPLREPTKVDSTIPPEISDVLMKALEIKRENRYDAAMIMRQVLKTAITRVQESDDVERQQPDDAEIIRQETLANAASEEAERREAEGKQLAEAQRKRLADEAQQKLRAAEVEEKRKQAVAEKQQQEEMMQSQLREAEEQRAQAERVAAAERQALQKEEAQRAAAEAGKSKVPDDNLLDIPVAAEVVAYRETSSVEEDELAAVLRELEEAEAAGNKSAIHEKSNNDQASSEDLIVFDSPIDLAAQAPVVDRGGSDEDEDIFTIPEKTASSLGMPVIAGGIVLVVVMIVGGWFLMSGSSEPQKPQPVPTVQVEQPAPVEANPVAETIVSSQSDANAAPVETPVEQAAVADKTAPAAKPKKETAKPAADKKKVTVDDLINDN